METDDAPLGSAYRVVRAVRAREDGPWPGVLVRSTEGGSHILVDADILGAEWAGWTAEPDGHVLAPVDVARRAGGHDAVMPVCLERVGDFVARRGARMPLAAGEAVTLAVSVLRGCGQVAAEPAVTGEWWLDDAGRPVLATDASATRVTDASASVLERVTVPPHMQRTWDTALRAITAERVSPHELAAAEDALFAIAAAEPLVTVSLSPRSATEAGPRPAVAGGDARVVHEPAPRSLWHALLRGVDDDLADSVSRATTAVWRRLRPGERTEARPARRAPWLVGGAVAAVVLAGGALWPAGGGIATGHPVATDPPPAAEATPHDGSDPLADGPGAGEATPAVDPAAAAPPTADLAVVAADLLDARLACENDAECLAAVVVDAAVITGGVVDRAAAERTITMLDDFGDLAVVRVDPLDGASASQLVVIERQNDRWLLRDVRDVAQQP